MHRPSCCCLVCGGCCFPSSMGEKLGFVGGGMIWSYCSTKCEPWVCNWGGGMCSYWSSTKYWGWLCPRTSSCTCSGTTCDWTHVNDLVQVIKLSWKMSKKTESLRNRSMSVYWIETLRPSGQQWSHPIRTISEQVLHVWIKDSLQIWTRELLQLRWWHLWIAVNGIGPVDRWASVGPCHRAIELALQTRTLICSRRVPLCLHISLTHSHLETLYIISSIR